MNNVLFELGNSEVRVLISKFSLIVVLASKINEEVIKTVKMVLEPKKRRPF